MLGECIITAVLHRYSITLIVIQDIIPKRVIIAVIKRNAIATVKGTIIIY